MPAIINARLATMCDAQLGIIENGALAWRGATLSYVGLQAELPPESFDGEVIDAQQGWLTPGLIDCHTHLVFAGNRADEFAQRLSGRSYAEIAAAGGGISSTVRHTQNASETELLAVALGRARVLMREGVSTIEIKSGYGLTLDAERKMLRVATVVAEQLGITVQRTFLGLHALPAEYRTRRAEFVREVAQVWLPQLHSEGLVDAVDAFCEGIGFTGAEVREFFTAARALGLPVKLHAEQLSDQRGSQLCSEFSGLSADHIEYLSEAGVAAMARSGTYAVLLPAAFYSLRETQAPPIAALRSAEVPMAVASDFNPGTAPQLSLRLALHQACTLFGLTVPEALLGATKHAAGALGLSDRGVLQAGMRADFALWQVESVAELVYWIGAIEPPKLWLAGNSALLS